MGTKAAPSVAPSVANLVMGDFEAKFVYTYHKQPLLWLRFIDDIFIIWTHGEEALLAFVDHLNSVHTTLKFTLEWSKIKVSFLDILVKILADGTIGTDLYVKPTDIHMYLHYSSCHPRNQKVSGPFSQLLRVRRNCSNQADFESHSDDILRHYKSRGYPASVLVAARTKAMTLDRDRI
jgi:hypothetical protein